MYIPDTLALFNLYCILSTLEEAEAGKVPQCQVVLEEVVLITLYQISFLILKLFFYQYFIDV